MIYTILGIVLVIVLIGWITSLIRKPNGGILKKFLLTVCLVILLFFLIGLLDHVI